MTAKKVVVKIAKKKIRPPRQYNKDYQVDCFSIGLLRLGDTVRVHGAFLVLEVDGFHIDNGLHFSGRREDDPGSSLLDFGWVQNDDEFDRLEKYAFAELYGQNSKKSIKRR